MTCREFIEFLIDYFADSLPADQRDTFHAHMSACPECVAYLNMYRQTVALGKAAHVDPAGHDPVGVPEDLIQAILAARQAG